MLSSLIAAARGGPPCGPSSMSPCVSRCRAGGKDEMIRQDPFPRDLLQRVQEPQHLLERASLVAGRVGEALQGRPCPKRRDHLI